MISIFALNFNHDTKDKELKFRQLVDSIASSNFSDVKPIVVETPVFSYARSGHQLLATLATQIGQNDAIVFLSEIVGYSYALVQSESSLNRSLPVLWQYESLDHFFRMANLRGFNVACRESLRFPKDQYLIVSILPREIVDEEFNPKPGIIRVLHQRETNSGTVYVYRVLDENKFFDTSFNDELPTYAVAGKVSPEEMTKQFKSETLTKYLLKLGVAFGTVNENHQDDLYAVSYHSDVWEVNSDNLAFIA